jgi:hypothetical protein
MLLLGLNPIMRDVISAVAEVMVNEIHDVAGVKPHHACEPKPCLLGQLTYHYG